MTIRFSQLDFTQASAFGTRYWVHTEAVGNKQLITLTGYVIIGFTGTGGDWRRETLELILDFPDIFPPGPVKWLKIEHWAPFVTINAITNEQQSVNAGWAVDDFRGPGPITIRQSVPILADIAVREVDGNLIRIGYSLTVSGIFVDPPPLD